MRDTTDQPAPSVDFAHREFRAADIDCKAGLIRNPRRSGTKSFNRRLLVHISFGSWRFERRRLRSDSPICFLDDNLRQVRTVMEEA